MRLSMPIALAAVLLIPLKLVYAAAPSQDDGAKAAIQQNDDATRQNDGTTVSPAAPASGDDDRTAKVIILAPDGLQDIPNPYANPGPRMISDAWAMRT